MNEWDNLLHLLQWELKQLPPTKISQQYLTTKGIICDTPGAGAVLVLVHKQQQQITSVQ